MFCESDEEEEEADQTVKKEVKEKKVFETEDRPGLGFTPKPKVMLTSGWLISVSTDI